MTTFIIAKLNKKANCDNYYKKLFRKLRKNGSGIEFKFDRTILNQRLELSVTDVLNDPNCRKASLLIFNKKRSTF